jgi:hypothetical protein
VSAISVPLKAVVKPKKAVAKPKRRFEVGGGTVRGLRLEVRSERLEGGRCEDGGKRSEVGGVR